MEGQDRNKKILLRVPWETGLKTSDPDRLMRCIYFSSYLGTTEVKLLRLQCPDGNCLEWTQGSCWLFAVGLDPDSSARSLRCVCARSHAQGNSMVLRCPSSWPLRLWWFEKLSGSQTSLKRSVRCVNSCFDILVAYMCFDTSWIYA